QICLNLRGMGFSRRYEARSLSLAGPGAETTRENRRRANPEVRLHGDEYELWKHRRDRVSPKESDGPLAKAERISVLRGLSGPDRVRRAHAISSAEGTAATLHLLGRRRLGGCGEEPDPDTNGIG